jgi:hypothetical protein
VNKGQTVADLSGTTHIVHATHPGVTPDESRKPCVWVEVETPSQLGFRKQFPESEVRCVD